MCNIHATYMYWLDFQVTFNVAAVGWYNVLIMDQHVIHTFYTHIVIQVA